MGKFNGVLIFSIVYGSIIGFLFFVFRKVDFREIRLKITLQLYILILKIAVIEKFFLKKVLKILGKNV